MPKKKGQPEEVGEELKIAVTLALQSFRLDDEQAEIEFPSSLTSDERLYIHRLSMTAGFKSKSRGRGANRYLTVYKEQGSSIVQADAVFQLSRTHRHTITTMLSKYPVTSRERQDLLPPSERDRLPLDLRDLSRATGRLNTGVPQVPPPCSPPGAPLFLPLHAHRDELLRAVSQHAVVVVSGAAGSGCSSQLPALLLEQHAARGIALRAVCVAPHRLVALNNAERVAASRGEPLGQTVGYQVQLESRVSPKTLLTFCTADVLLRSMMASADSALSSLTHVVVDELQERDRMVDLVVCVLRDALLRFRQLKLVLVTAADPSLYVKYFHGAPLVAIGERVSEVQHRFLDDILQQVEFDTPRMHSMRTLLQTADVVLPLWMNIVMSGGSEPQSGSHVVAADPSGKLSAELAQQMDSFLWQVWSGSDSPSACHSLLEMVADNSAALHYQHSRSSLSPLMVAAACGHVSFAHRLLLLGARSHQRAANGWSPRQWASWRQHTALVQLLEAWEQQEGDSEVSVGQHDTGRLRVYQMCSDDPGHVDESLAVAVLKHVVTELAEPSAAILLFLPDFDSVCRVRLLLSECAWLQAGEEGAVPPAVVHVLHAEMSSGELRRVLAPSDTCKIVLATDIAQWCVTLDDVAFVIDCGRRRVGNRLHWISRACVAQRSSRAGRRGRRSSWGQSQSGGVCFHLMSRSQLSALASARPADLSITAPHHLCLYTKLLATPLAPIADFLARAVDPPPYPASRAAVLQLKSMDALDPWEDITELGHHLMALPVRPCLGKAVIVSVVLKCLDPVLTIACCLHVGQVFTLSPSSTLRSACQSAAKLAANSLSDHMSVLRAFQAWQRARSEGWERQFCQQSCVSGPRLETVAALRAHVLGQLRALGFVRARGAGDIRDLNSHAENWAVVKAALCAGAYPHLARVDRQHLQVRTHQHSSVTFCRGSVLTPDPWSCRHDDPLRQLRDSVSAWPVDWLIYDRLSPGLNGARSACLHTASLLTPLCVALMAGPCRLPLEFVTEADAVLRGMRGDTLEDSDSESEQLTSPTPAPSVDTQRSLLKLDEWLWFSVDADAAHLTLQLRQKWHALLVRRLRAPGRTWSLADEAVLRALVTVLSGEEQSAGLQQPSGIGQRPRPVAAPHSALPADPQADPRPSSPSPVQPAAPHVSTCSDESLATELAASRSRFFLLRAEGSRVAEGTLSPGVCGGDWRRPLQLASDGLSVFVAVCVQAGGTPTSTVFHGVTRLVLAPADGEPCRLSWVRRGELPCHRTPHLLSLLADPRPLTELHPQLGLALCRLWLAGGVDSPLDPRCVPPAYQGRAIRGKQYIASVGQHPSRPFYPHRH